LGYLLGDFLPAHLVTLHAAKARKQLLEKELSRTAFDLDVAQLAVHREVLKVDGTRGCDGQSGTKANTLIKF
jgi:hypothetical protein